MDIRVAANRVLCATSSFQNEFVAVRPGAKAGNGLSGCATPWLTATLRLSRRSVLRWEHQWFTVIAAIPDPARTPVAANRGVS